MIKKNVITKNKKNPAVDNVSKSKSKKRNTEKIINDNSNAEQSHKKLKEDNNLTDVEDANANNSDEETKLDIESDDDEKMKRMEVADDEMKRMEIVDGISQYLENVSSSSNIHTVTSNGIEVSKVVSSNNIHTVTSVLQPRSPDSIKDTNQVETTGSSLVPANLGKNMANILTLADVAFQINTPKETISGFNIKSKQAMLDTLKPAQQMILRGLAHTKIFQQIKFIGANKLVMNSNIMENMYRNINVTDHNEKCKLHEALRHIVQRQLNSRRSYCIDKMVGQMKGMILIYSFFFFY